MIQEITLLETRNLWLIALVALCFLFTGCSEQQQKQIITKHISGTNSIIAYSNIKNGNYMMYITDHQGDLVHSIRKENNDVIDPLIEKNFLYFINYNDDNKQSDIIRCNLDQLDRCYILLKKSGSIRCMFSYRDRLYFYHSIYVKETHHDSGYARYRVFSVNFDGLDERKHFDKEFQHTVCPIVYKDRVFASMSFPFVDDIMISEGRVIIRKDYELLDRSGRFELYRAPVDIERSINLLMYIPDKVSYAGLNKSGRYQFGICIDVNKCDIDHPTTMPILLGDMIYYGVYNEKRDVLIISNLTF